MASNRIMMQFRFGPLPPELERLSQATGADLNWLRRHFPSLSKRKFTGADFVALVTVPDEPPGRGPLVKIIPTPLLKKLDRALRTRKPKEAVAPN